MKKAMLVVLAAAIWFAVVLASGELWGGIASVAIAFLAIAVSIVVVAVFSKAYKNWPM